MKKRSILTKHLPELTEEQQHRCMAAIHEILAKQIRGELSVPIRTDGKNTPRQQILREDSRIAESLQLHSDIQNAIRSLNSETEANDEDEQLALDFLKGKIAMNDPSYGDDPISKESTFSPKLYAFLKSEGILKRAYALRNNPESKIFSTGHPVASYVSEIGAWAVDDFEFWSNQNVKFNEQCIESLSIAYNTEPSLQPLFSEKLLEFLEKEGIVDRAAKLRLNEASIHNLNQYPVAEDIDELGIWGSDDYDFWEKMHRKFDDFQLTYDYRK